MRLVHLLVAAFGLSMVVVPGVAAAVGGPELDGVDYDASGNVTSNLRTEGVSYQEPAANRPSNAPPLKWAQHHEWAAMPDGSNQGLCVGVRWVSAESQEIADARAVEGNQRFFNLWSNLYSFNLPGADNSLPCPDVETAGVPMIVVRDVVLEIVTDQLPRPNPSIPPGRALTGLPAFLVTDHLLSYNEYHSVSIGGFIVNLTISARGTSTVDWGDGTVVSYDVPGTAYPDGEVRHTYQSTGQVTVTVYDEWVVDFTAGGAASGSDQLTARLDPATIDAFTVNQVQAVRVGPRG